MARTRPQELAAAGPFNGYPIAMAATILNGTSVSNIVDLGPLRLGAILFPAAWTAAALTFLVGYDGVNVTSLLDTADAEYQVAVTAARARLLEIKDFLPFNTLQLRSGLFAGPVNQAADRAFTLFLVP